MLEWRQGRATYLEHEGGGDGHPVTNAKEEIGGEREGGSTFLHHACEGPVLEGNAHDVDEGGSHGSRNLVIDAVFLNGIGGETRKKGRHHDNGREAAKSGVEVPFHPPPSRLPPPAFSRTPSHPSPH